MSTLRLRSEQVFAELTIYHDIDSRNAALNMAIDEALLESATAPTIRFYRWNHPALSFGYFGNFADVAEHQHNRDIVRRWTGGGIVFHGEDLTYSIVIPADDAAFSESSMSIYEKSHRALNVALTSSGQRSELWGAHAPRVRISAPSPKSSVKFATARARSPARKCGCAPQICFANPVRADVILNGKKIAGAAQRKTRRGLLQQGSIQGVDLAAGFEKSFTAELSDRCEENTLNDRILERAQEIAGQKYGTSTWLRRR